MVFLLNGGVAKPEEAVVSKQRLGKHAPAAIDTHAAIEELLEAVIFMRSVWWLSVCCNGLLSVYSRVEAGSNASTVTLRVVGGDIKKLSAWGYNWAIPFLGDINTWS
jgi:hypothetical protein